MGQEGLSGYQADGSYVPCPECRYVPPEDTSPSFAVAIPVMPRKPGVAIHRGDCPTVPQVSRETQDRLIEMDRVRRRGAAEARNFVIG